MRNRGKEGKKKKKNNHIFQTRQRNARLVRPALLERAALHSGVSPGGEWCCCLTKDSCWAESLITGRVPALGPSLRSHSAPAICTKFLSDLFVNMDPNGIKDELLSLPPPYFSTGTPFLIACSSCLSSPSPSSTRLGKGTVNGSKKKKSNER